MSDFLKSIGENNNPTFNILMNGFFSQALETNPPSVFVDPSEQAEIIRFHNSKVRAALRRPTLDSQASEAWDAPWNADLKMRMHLSLSSNNGSEFRLTDVDGNTFMLKDMNYAVLEDGLVVPYFQNDSDYKVGQPADEKYLMGLLGSASDPIEFELATLEQ